MRTPFVALLSGALSALAPATAGAVSVTINYRITGGMFNGPFSSGPITSGSVSVVFPFATSTSYAAFNTAVVGIALTGPSGFFQLGGPKFGLGGFSGGASGRFIVSFGGSPYNFGQTLTSGSVRRAWNFVNATLIARSGVITRGAVGGGNEYTPHLPFYHSFQGMEVVVPEPQPIGLLPVALVALALFLPMTMRQALTGVLRRGRSPHSSR
jgi:hypothetical protein